MSMKYDFEDYIVHYDRLYEDGHIYSKDAFKSSDGLTVPITANHWDFCMGIAVLENREDGVVAKCIFNDAVYSRMALGALMNENGYELVFEANEVERQGNKIVSGVITRVLYTPSEAVYHLVEEPTDA